MNGVLPFLWVLLAAAIDRLLGDPQGWLHPVQVMGAAIEGLRRPLERLAGDRPLPLRLAGVLITLVVVGASLLCGWGLERLAARLPWLGLPLLLLGLASALAARSLAEAVQAVLAALQPPGQLEQARQRLAWIVGRDTEALNADGILRAAAETAAENAVDGLFAPLFWMLLGAALASLVPGAPGPLALAWAFKAASTLDSMLGYRRGRLRWLGTAGARLDDLLTWMPCRLVALTLPVAAGRAPETPQLLRLALLDGAPDPSPNAGVSQAAYAHASGTRLGGLNHYAGQARFKPMLASHCPPPDEGAVKRMLRLSDRLELLWLSPAAALVAWELNRALQMAAQ